MRALGRRLSASLEKSGNAQSRTRPYFMKGKGLLLSKLPRAPAMRQRQIPRERQKYTERHRQRHTETCKLRGTPILRETPSSRKRHTVLRVRYIHTHTEAEKSKQGE